MNSLAVVLMTYSLHTAPIPNSQNLGVGLEYTQDLTYGAYVYDNSYGDTSYMVSVSKQHKYWGFGFAAANNYGQKGIWRNGILVGPEFTLKYKNIRVKTSYPFGSIFHVTDVFNLQFVFKLE